jgi:hypothetical protein
LGVRPAAQGAGRWRSRIKEWSRVPWVAVVGSTETTDGSSCRRLSEAPGVLCRDRPRPGIARDPRSLDNITKGPLLVFSFGALNCGDFCLVELWPDYGRSSARII